MGPVKTSQAAKDTQRQIHGHEFANSAVKGEERALMPVRVRYWKRLKLRVLQNSNDKTLPNVMKAQDTKQTHSITIASSKA